MNFRGYRGLFEYPIRAMISHETWVESLRNHAQLRYDENGYVRRPKQIPSRDFFRSVPASSSLTEAPAVAALAQMTVLPMQEPGLSVRMVAVQDETSKRELSLRTIVPVPVYRKISAPISRATFALKTVGSANGEVQASLKKSDERKKRPYEKISVISASVSGELSDRDITALSENPWCEHEHPSTPWKRSANSDNNLRLMTELRATISESAAAGQCMMSAATMVELLQSRGWYSCYVLFSLSSMSL